MPPSVAIVIPTRGRPEYLDAALATIAPPARAHGAEIIVVDDGPNAGTREVAHKHGARCIEPPAGTHGLNLARNAGIDATGADLIVFADDDVAVWDGWLQALLEAAAELPDDAGVITGPIRARVEDHRFPRCGRETGPVTEQDFGPVDADVPHAWGANLAIRRSALDRIGRFDPALSGGGDEEEWERRWLAAGGRIRYVAAAGVDHRRAGDDARLRSLCRAARTRGREARAFDERRGAAPPVRSELATLARCALHGPLRRCFMGPVTTWHSLGRVEAALRPGPPPPATPGVDDFLSGRSGTVGGLRGRLAGLRDALLDARAALSPARRRLDREAAALPRRRVLVLTVAREDAENRVAQARAELARSRHEVEHVAAPATRAGKFERLNELLAGRDLTSVDWLVVLDDDVDLPRGFLDRFLAAADRAGLLLAQPAHRLRSHAAWDVTRRVPGAVARETTFVEIGPVTAFAGATFGTLLPFPAGLRMGWGLDNHWSAVAAQSGWPIGVVDATPVGHLLRPAAASYPRADAIAEAGEFLAGRVYVTRDDVRTLRTLR
jgi:GT2 family glycosyltransferase